MDPLFVATFLTRLSAPPAQSMLAFHSSGLCLAHVGPWLCFLSGRVDEAHRASLHGSGERAPVEAEMSTDSFHLYGMSGLSIRELSPCWSVQGAGGVLIQLMSRGTAFPISANVTDFQRSVKLPIQGTRPITPSNVPLCPFQYLRRLFLGRQRLRVTGTLCYTWLPGPPYSGRVKASSHPWRQQYPGAENTAGLCSQTRRPPLE